MKKRHDWRSPVVKAASVQTPGGQERPRKSYGICFLESTRAGTKKDKWRARGVDAPILLALGYGREHEQTNHVNWREDEEER